LRRVPSSPSSLGGAWHSAVDDGLGEPGTRPARRRSRPWFRPADNSAACAHESSLCRRMIWEMPTPGLAGYSGGRSRDSGRPSWEKCGPDEPLFCGTTTFRHGPMFRPTEQLLAEVFTITSGFLRDRDARHKPSLRRRKSLRPSVHGRTDAPDGRRASPSRALVNLHSPVWAQGAVPRRYFGH
jgi:hypothetical protein